MSVNSHLINQLAHKIPEIRLRALDDLEKKIYNKSNVSNAPEIVKALIKWFANKPVQREVSVLKLLQFVLASSNATEMYEPKRIEKFKKEIKKLRELFTTAECLNLADAILEIFAAHEMKTIDLSSADDIDENAINLLENRSYINNMFNLTFNDNKFWETPSDIDCASINTIHESLCSKNQEELLHTINYIVFLVKDYPPEYFLQPPYLYKALTRIFEQEVKYTTKLLYILSDLVDSILSRIKFRQLSKHHSFCNKMGMNYNYKNVVISKFSWDLILLMLNFLDNVDTIVDNKCHFLCFVIIIKSIQLMHYDELLSPTVVFELLKELSSFAKNYRLCCDNHSNGSLYSIRTNYIIILRIMNDLLLLLKNRSHNEVIDLEKIEEYKNTTRVFFSNRSNNVLNEFELSLIDFSFKQAFPIIYNSIKDNIWPYIKSNQELIFIINSDNLLSPAVNILSHPFVYSNVELLRKGLDALDTINLFQSPKYIVMLFDVISTNCYINDEELSAGVERLVLKLLSHTDIFIRDTAYKMCFEKIKNFYASTGDDLCYRKIKKSERKQQQILHCFVGIPITTNILLEIISFGVYNSNTKIQENSRGILSILLKGETCMPENWGQLKDIFITIMPMLQCVMKYKSPLGDNILKISSPDSYIFDEFTILRANLRFLFYTEPAVRNEALNRIVYLITSYSETQNNEYLPNLSNISGTFSNDICILEKPIELRSIDIHEEDEYRQQKVEILIESFIKDSCQLKEKLSILSQLNILAEDSVICRRLYTSSLWAHILKLWYESMLIISKINPIPVIGSCTGIFLKMSLEVSAFRFCLSEDIHFHYLLMRSLLLHHHNYNFKTDTVSLLFTILFHSYICKINNTLSFPKILISSELVQIPYLCGFHNELSHWSNNSTFEDIFLTQNAREPIHCYDENHFDHYSKNLRQYMRMSFALLWFGELNCIVENLNESGSMPDYAGFIRKSHLIDDDGNKLSCITDFNLTMRLHKHDLDIIKATVSNQKLNYFAKNTSEADCHETVSYLVNQILCLFILPVTVTTESSKLIIKNFQKFILNTPGDSLDERLFISIIEMFGHFITNGLNRISGWLLKNLELENILVRYYENQEIFPKCVNFILILLEFYNSKTLDRHNCVTDLNQQLLEIITKLLLDKSTIEFVKIRSLVLLLSRIKIEAVDLDLILTGVILNQLMAIIVGFRCLSQCGSNLTLNCLTSMRNFLKNTKFHSEILSDKHLKLLSSLCCHINPLIRCSSWNILTEIASSLNGAELVIKGLSHLPSGVHACALSTILDEEECSLIISSAASVLVTLLSYESESRTLEPLVKPSFDPKVYNAEQPLSILSKIIKDHQFYDKMMMSLRSFSLCDKVDLHNMNLIIDSDCITSYCIIVRKLIRLHVSSVDEIVENNCVPQMAKLFLCVPSKPSIANLNMYAAICNLINDCLYHKLELYTKIIGPNRSIIIGLFYLLTFKKDANIRIENYSIMTKNVLATLYYIAMIDVGFRSICGILSEIAIDSFVESMVHCLSNSSCSGLQLSCVSLLNVLLRQSSNVSLNDDDESFIHYFEQISSISISDSEVIKQMSNTGENISLNQILFLKLFNLFNVNMEIDLEITLYAAIQIILRISESARNSAQKVQFLDCIIIKLADINSIMSLPNKSLENLSRQLKDRELMKQVSLLNGIIYNWYSQSTLVDNNQIEALFKEILILWKWTIMNEHLEMTIIKVLLYLSEDSIAVCRGILVSHSNANKTTLISLIVRKILSETESMRKLKTRVKILEYSMRIISNCCAIIEGRLQLEKLNVLHTIEKLHPSVTKISTGANIIIIWLNFWEIYSRYPEGMKISNMSVLYALICHQNTNSFIRLLSLRILRNISFGTQARSILLSSNEFMSVISHTLESNEDEEIKLALTIIWKLIENNVKAKHKIKCSSIKARISFLHQNSLSHITKDCDKSVCEIVNILYNALQ